MNYIKGEPETEGLYLTICKYRYDNEFTTPKLLNYKYSRLRATNELVLDEDGNKIGKWLDSANNGQSAEYYCNLPQLPIL